MMFGLPEPTQRKMMDVFARFPEVEQVVIYGSRAKGNFRPGSDIDLTLIGQSLNEADLSKILLELDDLNTPYLMDVSLYHQIQSDELKQHIENVGQVFYQR